LLGSLLWESPKRSRIAASESMINIFLHPPDDCLVHVIV
jgi:hypothetical protein